jgi:hypothetical protein
MNVNMANQNTGVISTPNAGGIFPLASLSNGSEGHATIAQGNVFKFVSGYQDETTRQSCYIYITQFIQKEKRKRKYYYDEVKTNNELRVLSFIISWHYSSVTIILVVNESS